jgi:hypothetical protein
MEWILGKFLGPVLRNQNALPSLIVFLNFVSFRVGLCDNISHILSFESAENSKEKAFLWQAISELFFTWEILREDRVLVRVGVHVFYRELGVARHIKMDDLVCF